MIPRALAALSILLVACQPGREHPDPAAAVTVRRAALTADTREPSITLITGDRVEVEQGPGGRRRFRAIAGPGRGAIRFVQLQRKHGPLVIPSDAAPLLAAGALDERLFDVELLLRDGYDDRSRAELPLIVRYEAGPGLRAPARAALQTGARETRALTSIDASALLARKSEAGRFWAAVTGGSGGRSLLPGVRKLVLDRRVRAVLDVSVPQVGAPAAWGAGYTGQGIKVAVLDTGIQDSHPDLVGKVVAAANFVGSGDTGDRVGHGTHVASIVAGTGAASAGRYTGVAPAATLLNGKVLDDSGVGHDSSVIAGMEWAVAQGAKVVNMSLGHDDDPGVDPIEESVNQLTAQHGTLFVIAAGNEGELGPQTVGSPGSADAALTVGAVSRTDTLASFSSRGPRRGDFAVKPDLTAPGVAIVAARVPGTLVGDEDPIDDHHARVSGTSMATPHVAGAAALLLQQNPSWSAAQLKPVLMGSARSISGQTAFEQGAGRLDIGRGIAQPVYASPSSLGYGLIPWPQSDDAPVDRPLILHNGGTAALTLSLAAALRDRAGTSAPAGMLKVTPAQLTVPAGGSATATVTLDARLGATVEWTGAVTASAGAATVVQIPVGLIKEVETHEYTMTIRTRAGELSHAIGGVLDTQTFEEHRDLHQDPDGLVRLRLPRGRYVVYAAIPGGSSQDWVLFGNPNLLLDRPIHQTFDGRQASPVALTVERNTARLVESQISVGYRFGPEEHHLVGRIPVGVLVDGSSAGDASLSRTFLIGSATGSDNAFTTLVYTLWAQPNGGGGDPVAMFHNSPYRYTLAQLVQRRVPTSPTWVVKDADLGRVTSKYAFNLASTTGATISDVEVLGTPWFGPVPFSVSSDLPFSRTDLFTPGVTWYHVFLQVDAGRNAVLDEAVGKRSYVAGQAVTEQWNLGPFGPGFGVPLTLFDQPVYRTGDQLSLLVPMFSDSVPTHYGLAGFVTGQQVLFRDGVEIASDIWPARLRVEVPPAAATYRLNVDVSQIPEIPSSRLSTRLIGDWTFRSAHVDATTRRPLALMAVRYVPPLDQRNRAPAAGRFSIPIAVQRPPGETSATTSSLGLEASFDDGQSWAAVPVTGNGATWTATLDHPALDNTSGFVALRAAATDTSGNGTTQTIIRAYELTEPQLLSRDRPALASSEGGASFAARFAVDGNLGTRWASVRNADPQWLRVDLGQAATINRVRVIWDLSCARSYRIETSSNGTSWTSIFATTVGDGGTDDLAVSGQGRYLRLFGTVRCRPNQGYSVQEIEVYGLPN